MSAPPFFFLGSKTMIPKHKRVSAALLLMQFQQSLLICVWKIKAVRLCIYLGMCTYMHVYTYSQSYFGTYISVHTHVNLHCWESVYVHLYAHMCVHACIQKSIGIYVRIHNPAVHTPKNKNAKHVSYV